MFYEVSARMLRQPIVTILGHVDHGKTSLLDKIRGSGVAAKEAGGITQAIGASILPLATLKAICGALLDALKLKLTIPGLLFIDTPGHAAFTNLRKRGGNLADIAVLVVDVNEGFMPQTLESIEILKNYKTPFVIAANKIDLVERWFSHKDKPLLQNLSEQDMTTIRAFETKMYALVGKLSELGLQSERFDRVEDYTKQVAIVPVSAKTGEGVPELLMVLTGLAQKFLEEHLKVDAHGQAKGTVLEVKEEKGLGKVLDVIIYDGTLKVNDTIVIGGLEKPIVTKVRALFVPAPLAEMREKKTKFQSVREVAAAMGVRISATGIEDVVAGVPLLGADANLEEAQQYVQKEIAEVLITTASEGVVIKADTLGSLEALSKLLQDKNISIKRASVGLIAKKDLSDAEANFEKNPLQTVILGFNIPLPAEAAGNVKVITSDVIYRLIEEYDAWQQEQKKRVELSKMEHLVRPAKIQLLSGYVFRQSNPAVVGIEVLAGTLKPNTPLMKKDGKEVAVVKKIQQEQESVSEAKKTSRVAIALPGVIVGRQLKEGDTLYSMIPEEHFRTYKEFKEYLTTDEKELLKEIAIIMREKNPVWGV